MASSPAERTARPPAPPHGTTARSAPQGTWAPTLSAFLMLISGIGLNVASFCLPPLGTLSDSTMTFMGEALIYAASVFGMKAYVEQRLRSLSGQQRTDI